MPPPRLARLLLASLLGSLAPTASWAKMVMGIASGENYHLISTFCFTFPSVVDGDPIPNGHIHSQTIVSSNGHKFMVLNYTELEQGLPCDELMRRAKVIEPLTERTKEVIAYDLTLNVEPSMDRQHIAAVITRCGQPINAEYIVEFSNPGGYLERHFACSDQGLLQSYLWLSLAAAFLATFFWSAMRVLHHRQAHNDLSAMFFTSAGFFAGRLWLFAVHLLVYSRNGMGLGMLLFVTQFMDFICTMMLTVVLIGLVHGVYVTRPGVPPGSEERRALLRVTGAFAASYLVSTLATGFRVDGQLTPFGVLHSSASTPYVACRVLTGIFCLNRALVLVKDADPTIQLKKPFILRFGFVAFGWLVFLPLIMIFSAEDSWHRDSVLMDLSNFATFGIILRDFWPSRFGALFSCMKPTERMHPYSEFGLDG